MEEVREKIARKLWLYDRENHLIPCDSCSFRPVALPEMALSLKINTVHYGEQADQILSIEVRKGVTIKDLIEKGAKG